MAEPSTFPHLHWSHKGVFNAKFKKAYQPNAEVAAAKADPTGHTGRIRGKLGHLRQETEQLNAARIQSGLPVIKGRGFLLRVPEGTNVDDLAYALGIELVAETESGLMFAASDNIDLARLEEILANFEIGAEGGGRASDILDVFDARDDERKLDELLVGRVREIWPYGARTIYTFDIGIQTATSTRSFDWSPLQRKRHGVSAEQRAAYNTELRRQDMMRAEEIWNDAADARFAELNEFVSHYGGEFLNGRIHDDAVENSIGIVFPDSIETRLRMSGEGFCDLVENFPHLFEVSLPPEIRYLPGSPELAGDVGDLEIIPPHAAAPAVCVIDSGIEEGHRWLEPAIDKTSSRCFIPELESDNVADEVPPRGHGTRVAGAVLYPRDVPQSGSFQPVAWIQNARVLDASCQLPITLAPERYLTNVVDHFSGEGAHTRIFNHSISDLKPCQGKRMCAWAAKIDDLVHRHDLLFIQVSGNFETSEIFDELRNGGSHPDQLLSLRAKVASPGQSLHALTVGSVAHAFFDNGMHRSFASGPDQPSAFSRSGHSPLWGVVKPEVVEYGGDRVHEIPMSRNMPTRSDTAPVLLASTLHGAPAISRDDVGTSFAAPKVSHIAAHLQSLFPGGSALLYRALIVQSARWPAWAEAEPDSDKVLRLIGYGLPSVDRATTNNRNRVTVITNVAQEIWSKHYHLYKIRVPDEIRSAALEARIRIDITLAYTASPRRTRSRRTGYLETWLDWRSSCRDEPVALFAERMEGKRKNKFPGFPWKIHQDTQHGDVDVSRDRGSVQKDWVILESNELPEEFSIAVRAHTGWNHKEGGGLARYCLAVSFESLDLDLPVYASVELALRTEVEAEVETELQIPETP